MVLIFGFNFTSLSFVIGIRYQLGENTDGVNLIGIKLNNLSSNINEVYTNDIGNIFNDSQIFQNQSFQQQQKKYH